MVVVLSESLIFFTLFCFSYKYLSVYRYLAIFDLRFDIMYYIFISQNLAIMISIL